jgi:hypothetical protein
VVQPCKRVDWVHLNKRMGIKIKKKTKKKKLDDLWVLVGSIKKRMQETNFAMNPKTLES